MTKEQLIEKYKDQEFTVYSVYESNPYGGSTSETWYLDEGEAESYYEECCDRQGGRSSFDDDHGGMDYGIDEYTKNIEELINEMGTWDVAKFLGEEVED